MNYFFALELPEDVRQELAAQVNHWRLEFEQVLKLEGWRPSYRWVEPRNYHITLKFLGDVPESAVERAIEKAQHIAEARQPLRVRLAQAGGVFKKQRLSTGILWMGVRHDADLEELGYALHEAIPTYTTNTSPLQHYKPHITIARGTWAPEKFGYRLAYEHSFPSWQATQFVLMQTLPPQQRAKEANARYNTVHTFPFRNTQL